MSEPAKKPKKPRRFGGFELIRRLGRGSMGAVFLARQTSSDRLVAIKILAPRFSRDESYVNRFLREAESAAKLEHPSIIGAIDVGEVDGLKYFVMEYIEGPTLADLLRRGGALDESRAVSMVLQIARALEHAHENGFVHRDIKPANVILTSEGVAKLCDLGLAKEVDADGGDTQDGQTLGTPDYISPEQARGDPIIDIRTDIYSLGATFYHLVTGRVPYAGPTPAVVMTKHLTEGVPDPRNLNSAISPAVSEVIRKMLAKEPGDRHEDPAALIVELTAIAEGTYRKKFPALTRKRTRRRRRRF